MTKTIELCDRCSGSGADTKILHPINQPNCRFPCRDCNGTGEKGFVKLWPDALIAPDFFPTHCQEVFDGVYDVPLDFEGFDKPVILDIGANVGAFVRWTWKRWRGRVIHCYEPSPTNYYKLLSTIATFQTLDGSLNFDESQMIALPPRKPLIFPRNVAVLNKDCKMKLTFGASFNCGEHSLLKQPDNSSVEVDVIDAANLPKADILKIDAEGAEPFILDRLCDANRLREFSAIVLEWHTPEHAAFIRGLLKGAGFKIYKEKIDAPSRGTCNWIRG